MQQHPGEGVVRSSLDATLQRDLEGLVRRSAVNLEREAQISILAVQIDGRAVPLAEAPDLPTWFVEGLLSNDDEVTEKVVPVAWDVTRSIDEAVTTPGIFASQVTACKLRDERTIEFLQQAFQVSHEP